MSSYLKSFVCIISLFCYIARIPISNSFKNCFRTWRPWPPDRLIRHAYAYMAMSSSNLSFFSAHNALLIFQAFKKRSLIKNCVTQPKHISA